MKECYRCGRDYEPGHYYYCETCEIERKHETPEEKARIKEGRKLLKAAQTKKKIPSSKKYGVSAAALWNTRVQNWKKLGIINPPETKEEYDEMVLDLGGICPACRRPPAPVKGRSGWQLHHNHESGLVVGILCQRCNMGMGQFEDNPDLMMNVAFWLVEQENKSSLYT